jgi:superfamily I DNA/RNA helicase/mRNA-degrading endonuclease RelE of RelBE toxin-antitoxin system
MTQFAISADFLTSLSYLPRQAQRQVGSFVFKFRHDPRSPGINLERIQGARDGRLFSVRINDDYRGVVARPDGSDTVLLLWVDKHDDAYAWARRRRCEINPETGALQIVDVQTVEEASAEAPTVPVLRAPGLFNEVHDRHLQKLGVPESFLPAVRRIASDEELEALAPSLPEEAAEAMFMLAAGYRLEEVLAEQEKSAALPQYAVEPGALDADAGFEQALVNPDSRQRFWVVDDDGTLEAMLNEPLEKWRVFLHPSQRRLVERHWNGPVRVLGGAGTGKTVVAMHRARWLAEHLAESPEEASGRVLFVTFTRNLAADIEANLRRLCPLETMGRIRVATVDGLVADHLKRRGYAHDIVFDDDPMVEEAWQEALTEKDDGLGLPDRFFRDEWREVVQSQGIAAEEDYLKAPRSGRGQALNRIRRRQVWTVLAAYRAALAARGVKESVDAIRDLRRLLENGEVAGLCRHIVVDEAQDMGAEAFRLLRRLAGAQRPDDLFLVGDGHQRIYGRRASLCACGIDIRGRGRKLRLNYRTTEEIRRFACAVLQGVAVDDLDDGTDDLRGYRSLMHGGPPTVHGYADSAAQARAIAGHVRALRDDGASAAGICLALPTNRDLDRWEQILAGEGIVTRRIQRRAADDPGALGVRLATMHRVKGLQFDHVILPDLDAGRFPDSHVLAQLADDIERRRYLDRCRSLLFVALTRAKLSVYVTCVGRCTALLPSLDRGC